jgi:hypothetical protein
MASNLFVVLFYKEVSTQKIRQRKIDKTCLFFREKILLTTSVRKLGLFFVV